MSEAPRGRPVRARLQRTLIFWFGAAILATGLTFTAMNALGGGPPFRRDVERVARFVAADVARAWGDQAARDAVVADAAAALRDRVRLVAADGAELAASGAAGDGPSVEAPVMHDGATVARLVLTHTHPRPWLAQRLTVLLVVCGAVLWAAAWVIANRLARPFEELTRVARDIGAGRLSSRMELARGGRDEVGEIASAVNDMAERIERQLADQRELLAAVSHELRTPLGHVRLLAELLRDGAKQPELIDEIDREVQEIDALVGDLLASARVDFAALSPTDVDAAELARRALDRAGLDASLLQVDGESMARADPTLVARALANLVDNAVRHGGGLEVLRVRGDAERVAFEVDDAGEGFANGEETQVFQPFFRRPGAPARDARSLGLGLSLVKRIAEAHRGRAWAANREPRGARVGFDVAR